MSFPNSAISDIIATTIQSRTGQIQDNVTSNNALLMKLKQRGNIKTFSGGNTIMQELSFASNGNAGWYSGYETLPLAAKRGVYLTPEQAYNRAIAMNPEVSKLVNEQQQAEAKRAAARKANDDAQRALKASVSVGGSPGGTPSGASGATDRRSVIAAAFDSVGGRM